MQGLAGSGDEFSPQLRATAHTSAEVDYTTVVELQGLQPGTTYRYNVVVDGTSVLEPDCPSFHTFLSRGTPSQFGIGFGGGAGYVTQNERMWDVIRSHQPLAFFFLGDNVYIDLPDVPKPDPTVTYRIISIDDEVKGELTLKRSELTHTE